jgi:hypothetical protein
MDQPIQIIRVLKVRDTRQYEEQGDRWVPIHGSGQARECARCGREHEVHAEVLLANGKSAIIGTGCADKSTMDPAIRAAATSGDRAAKKLAALRAELAGKLAKVAAWDAAWLEVVALPFPAVREESSAIGAEAHDLGELIMGDASIPLRTWTERAEREQCLTSSWRMKRMEERGFNRWKDQIPAYRLKDLEDAIEKLLKRHPELNGSKP